MKKTAIWKERPKGYLQASAVFIILVLLISISSLDQVNALTTATDFGTGNDGDLTILDGQTGYVDAVKSALTASSSAGQTQIQVADAANFAVGHEVLIIQMTGSQAGHYEFAFISSASASTLDLETPLLNTYLVDTSSKAQVLWVPHFQNVTVHSGATLTSQVWDGSTGGVLSFRVLGEMVVEEGGNVHVFGGGFRGGNNQHMSIGGSNGESTDGFLGTGGGVGQSGSNGGGSGSLRTVASPRGNRSGGGGGGTYDHTGSGQGDEGSGGGGGAGHLTAGGGGGGGGDGYGLGGPGGLTTTTMEIGGGNGGPESLGGGAAGSQVLGYTGYGGFSWSSPDRGTGGGGGGSSSQDASDGFIVMMGAGGGQGGHYHGRNGLGAFYGASGGDGGGILMIYANNFSCLGAGCLDAGGEDGSPSSSQSGSGGGGAGGYIFVRSAVIDIGTNYISSAGGMGGVGSHGASGDGGQGGSGRVRLEYCESFTGTTDTSPSVQKVSCILPTPTPTNTPTATNTLVPTPTPIPTSTPVPMIPPVAVAGTSLDSAGLLQLDGSLSYDPDGTVVSYSWNISGDTSTYNGKKVSIASLAPGTYTIQLTVSDNDGMTDSDTMLLGIKNADDGEDVVELEKPGVKLRQYPVGVEDEVYGKEGSTQAFVTILIYADAELTNLIATTTSNGDGSVSPVGIGDNSFAEVYVIARDQDGNTSKAKKLKNDIQPPVILHTSPNDEADKVKRNTKVVITFNEIMNEGLTILAFSIDGDVTGMLRVDGKRLVFIPDGLLEANTTYTVIISGVAADLAGNPIGVELVFTFTTGNK